MDQEINVYAPIIIPTLNRIEHFKRCVESLAKCTLANKTELIIALDYPPSEKYVDGWKKICDYLPTITGFGKVTIIKHDSNLGAVKNALDLMEFARSYYDCFIFTEDDNEFAPNFLEYINWGLKKYKDDDSIFAICGFKEIPTDDIQNNVYKLNRIFSAWGYGTWYNRIDKLNKFYDHEIIKKIINEASIFDAFSRKVSKLSSLTYQLAKKTFFGDMMVSLLPTDEKWCIFPSINKVRNWGWDGSGLHGGSPELIKKYSAMYIDENIHFEPVIVEDLYNPIVFDRFKKQYKVSTKSYLRSSITFLCYKLTGYIPVANKESKWCKVKLQKVH